MKKKAAAPPAARRFKNKLDPKIIHSLDKGLEVLELVAASGEEVGLSELAEALKWDKSTVFRLLTTLIRRGYVDQDADTKRYRLGFRILHLERQLFQSLDLPRLSRDLLTRLANATGEAAHLATLHRGQVIIIAQRDSPERMAVNAHVGTIEPVHCTALGKAILMQMSEQELKDTLAACDFVAYTPRTLTSPQALLENVRRARLAGYALDDEEFMPEVRCIAAPAVIPNSQLLHAIGVSGPASRIVTGRIPSMAEQVQRAAQEFARLFEAPKAG